MFPYSVNQSREDRYPFKSSPLAHHQFASIEYAQSLFTPFLKSYQSFNRCFTANSLSISAILFIKTE
jgi:hypothetical protein